MATSGSPEVSEALLEFVETLIHDYQGQCLSDLQRTILLEALQGGRRTYDELAEELGYSGKYIKQNVAPKLWHLVSEAIGQKVSKINVRPCLVQYQQQYQQYQQYQQRPASPTSQPKTLPIPRFPVPHQAPNPNLVPDPLTSPKARILLVDDEPHNLALLSDMLENEGYLVRQAINGNLALRGVSIELPDLILLDVSMHPLDGYEVCQRLKSNPYTQHIPVIFISALNEPWNKVKAFSMGGSDYITKPLKVIEVMARIENQLQLQRLQIQFQQISAQCQHMQGILKHLDIFNPMTGLLDRSGFDRLLQQIWTTTQQEQTPLTLLLCVINPGVADPGVVNPSSDLASAPPQFNWQELAQPIMQTIATQLPQADYFLGAYDAQTIAILLPQTNSAAGAAMAQTIAQTLKPLGQELAIRLKIGGTSLIPSIDCNATLLTQKANQVLHQGEKVKIEGDVEVTFD